MSRAERTQTDPRRSAARVGLAALVATAVLGWLAVHTEVVFADGLRYVSQARRFERGDWQGGLLRAVDHPLYPLAVAATHRAFQLPDTPRAWQAAAQGASIAAGVLLLVPLYLVARSLFGRGAAWLGGLMVYLAPVPARVAADGLSESTFLLCWTWGVWAALGFLKAGSTAWLLAALGFGGLAYLARPEGLLLPVALTATLVVSTLVPAARLPRRRWWAAIVLIGLGAAALVGPYVFVRGGIGTKPAVARLLGLAPSSPRDAVERERPLDPDHDRIATTLLAARASLSAVKGAVTAGLLPFAALGLAVTVHRRWPVAARAWTFHAVLVGGSLLALARLHATGGYCTPRHALLVALPLFAAAGSGLRISAAIALRAGRRAALGRRVATALPAVAVAAWLSTHAAGLLAPLNEGYTGYREAGDWLSRHVSPGARVVDATGWSLFYGDRPGYVFANLHEAPADPALRWVVVREAHLRGPWGYCDRLRGLVAGARVAAQFPARPRPGLARVLVFERPIDPRTAHGARAGRY